MGLQSVPQLCSFRNIALWGDPQVNVGLNQNVILKLPWKTYLTRELG